jgi:hypothetical protein
MSVNHPIKMQFFQFSPPNGLVLEAITGIMFGSLPGILAVYFRHTEGLRAVWKIALVLSCGGLVYLVSLWHMGNRFSRKQDRILSALT